MFTWTDLDALRSTGFEVSDFLTAAFTTSLVMTSKTMMGEKK